MSQSVSVYPGNQTCHCLCCHAQLPSTCHSLPSALPGGDCQYPTSFAMLLSATRNWITPPLSTGPLNSTYHIRQFKSPMGSSSLARSLIEFNFKSGDRLAYRHSANNSRIKFTWTVCRRTGHSIGVAHQLLTLHLAWTLCFK